MMNKAASLFLFFSLAMYPSTSIAQSRHTITIDRKDASLKDIFFEVNRQTGFEFIYSSDLLKGVPPVSIKVKDATVDEVLKICLNGQPFKWVIEDKTIMVQEKEEVTTLKKNEAPTTSVNTRVTGTVRDKDGNALPGANVIIKGTTTGTGTDEDGDFSINAENDQTLIVTFIGFKNQEIPLGGRIQVDVVLEEDQTKLGEVVINGGYYETTNELKTGSIVKVASKEIENQPVTSPLMALQGRVAGLDITPNNGTPGTAPVIRIRGNNSLRISKGTNNVRPEDEGNYPLYVIDGVPINSVPVASFGSTFSSGGYDPLSTINPSNIESIEILKDADATAIYGSRGANGVILITTKHKTKSTEHTNIDLSAYRGVGQVSRRMDLLSTQQYVAMRKEALRNDGLPINDLYAKDLTQWDTTRYTDWQKVLLGGSANITDIQGGISSGNKNTSFNFGGGYHKETLVTPGDFGYKRGTGNLSINHISTDQRFKAGAAINYGVDKSELFQGEFVSAALSLAPNAPALYDINGDLNWEMRTIDGAVQPTWINPMSYTQQTANKTARNLNVNSSLSYAFPFGLTLLATGGITDLVSFERTKMPISSQAPSTATLYGMASSIDSKRTSWIVEPKGSYSKDWSNHSLNVLIGSTWQERTDYKNFTTSSRYVSDALLNSLQGAGKLYPVEESPIYKFASIFGRAGYNFNDKYLLNVTIRRDGSSRFGPDNRFGNFWSVGGGWVFSNENLIKENLSFFTFGKIRASYGVTGSDAVGDYKYYNLYDIAVGYQGTVGLIPSSPYNPKYAWGVTKKMETAIELSFFESRLSAEVSWYRNRSSNQLVDYPLAASSGFSSVIQNFDAVVQNTGWEFMLRATAFTSDEWNWIVSVNATLPNNKLVKFDGIDDSPYATLFKVGQPLTIQYLYSYQGVNRETGLYQVADRNTDGVINDLDRILTNPLGKSMYGGVNNMVKYGSFELSVLFQLARQKGQRIIGSYPGTFNANQPTEVLNRWRQAGDNTGIQRVGTNAGSAVASYVYASSSDFMAVDASFIRLKTLSLGYLLPLTWITKLKLQQAKVFVQGQNLLTITSYSGLDPETGNSLPPLRMLTAGLQLKL